MGSRNIHIDIVKGVGILLIVLGHNYMADHNAELKEVLFSFHVPLFFYCAGLFFKTERSFSSTALSKFQSLLKPYFITGVILAAGFVVLKNEPFVNSVAGLLYGTGDTLHWTPMWFLPHLFALTLVMWGLIRMSERLPDYPAMRMAPFVVLFGLYIFALKGTFPAEGLPFSLDLVFVSGLFFAAGYYTKHKALHFKPSWWMAGLALAIFAGTHIASDAFVDLNKRTYDSAFFNTVQAACGIYLVLCSASLLNAVPKIREGLAYVGAASLYILIFHYYIQIKAFGALDGRLPLMMAAFGSFAIGSAVPLLIYEAVKRRDTLTMVISMFRKRSTQ